MKGYLKYWFSALLVVCLSMAVFSCKQSSKTSILPLPVAGSGGGGGGGGDDGGDVSATAVMLNSATEATNFYYQYYAAYNNAGWGMAIWNSSTGQTTHIVYSVYDPAAGAWSAPREFAAYGDNPGVASSSTGFMVVYQSGSRIYARSWSGGSFGAVVKISGDGINCYNPVIASNGSGYCAAWQQHNTDRYNTYAAVYSGAAWGSSAELDTTADSPDNHMISTDGAGYCVTWRESSSPDRLFAAVYAASSWTTGEAVDDGTWPASYRVAGSASRYVIVFQNSSNDIYTNVYNAGWGGASLIESSGGAAYDPRIASNGATFCCVWYQWDGSYYSIFSRTYNGSAWDSVQNIDNGDFHAYSPDIAASGSGYCAVWYQHDGTTSNKIYARRYTTSWQGIEPLNPLNTEGSNQPRICANGSGYMTYWYEYVSGEARIGSSVYDGSAWSAMALVDPEYHSNQGLLAYPFTGGYGFSYAYSESAGPGLMANVYRDGAWAGSADVTGGQLRGTCFSGTAPFLYRAGTSTIGVWTQWDKKYGGNNELYASVRSGSSWGAPVRLGGYIPDYYSYYAASNGTAVCVVWMEMDNVKNRYKLLGAIYSGGAWGGAVLLDNDIDSRSVSYPRVAGNGSANDFCVIWLQQDGSDISLFANFHTASGWGGPTAEIDNGAGSADSSWLMAGDASYCAVFNQNGRTYGTVSNVSGVTWSGAPEELDGANLFYPTRYTMAASGDLFAVINNRSYDIYANVYDGSSWSGMAAQDKTQSNSAYGPAVTGDGAGGFCLAWYEYANPCQIIVRIYDDPNWGDAASLNYADEFLAMNEAYYPRIASNGSGYGVAFIQHNGFFGYDLYANVFDSGAGLWLGAQVLDDQAMTLENQDYSVGSSGTGYGVAWRQWNEDGVRMAYGSAYDGSDWQLSVLSNGEGNTGVPDVIGAGSGYVAGWLQADAAQNGVYNLWSDFFD